MTDVVYPRAYLEISAIVGGSEVVTGIEPTKLDLTLRPHTQADTLEATIHGSALPYDPHVIESVFVTAYLGAPATADGRVNTEEFVRFMGYMDQGTIKRAGGPEIELKARDLSSILRDAKPLAAAIAPKYSDTPRQAIQRILDHVAGGSLLTLAHTTALDDAPGLSTRVHSRAQSGPIPIKRDASAWEAIEHVCGMVARRVTVRLDTLLVQSPRDAFTNDDEAQAVFIYGTEDANLLEVEYTKKFLRNRKGIRVVGFNPETRTRVEAVYPEDADLPPRRRARPRGRHTAPDPPERDIVPIGDGLWDGRALLEYARAIYEERSRSELDGTLSCPDWKGVDVFALKNGNRIEIRIQPDLAAQVLAMRDDQVAVNFLKTRLGVSDEAAQLLVDAARNGGTRLYHVRNVHHRFVGKGVSMTKVDFLALVDVPQ